MTNVTKISTPEPEANGCTIRSGISGPSSGGNLARKRYQRGALRREGNLWILRWREDVLNEAGEVVRVERRARVSSTKDLPTKALARRVADKMVEHVNEPNYIPGRVATVEEFLRDVPHECLSDVQAVVLRICALPVPDLHRTGARPLPAGSGKRRSPAVAGERSAAAAPES